MAPFLGQLVQRPSRYGCFDSPGGQARLASRAPADSRYQVVRRFKLVADGLRLRPCLWPSDLARKRSDPLLRLSATC